MLNWRDSGQLASFLSMHPARNCYLLIGAALSAFAALAHLGCIVFGAPWYRFFGAGEQMAQMAESGHWFPPIVTLAVAAVLFTWSAYALSGAGLIRRLPMLKLALCAITVIYIVRGLAFVAIMPMFPGNSTAFWIVSSAICLAFGTVHLVGVRQMWVRQG